MQVRPDAPVGSPQHEWADTRADHQGPQQEISYHHPAGRGGAGPRPTTHLRGGYRRRELQTWHAREMGPRIRGPEWYQPRPRHGAGVWIRTDRTIQGPGGVWIHRR